MAIYYFLAVLRPSDAVNDKQSDVPVDEAYVHVPFAANYERREEPVQANCVVAGRLSQMDMLSKRGGVGHDWITMEETMGLVGQVSAWLKSHGATSQLPDEIDADDSAAIVAWVNGERIAVNPVVPVDGTEIDHRQLRGISKATQGKLADVGIVTVEQLAEAKIDLLVPIANREARAKAWIVVAKKHLAEMGTDGEDTAPIEPVTVPLEETSRE